MPAVSTTQFTRVTTAFTTSSALYRAAFASLIMAASVSSAYAQVGVGEQVVGGTAQFNRPDNNTLIVTTQQSKTIINWQNLDILNNQSAHFNQQAGANAVTLNRIGGGSPTKILGSLSSNGKLVLVNPNGVFFGAGSRVDVAGLVATTADIGNAAFMNGSTNFNKPGRADASIINKGTITAAEGGLVALVAPAVRNDGVIVAKSGAVKLGAAQTVTVDFYGDNLYSFALGKKADAPGKDENGNDMKSAVENNGSISATGGTIMLTANAAKEVVTNAVNNTGILEASAARVEGGEIILDGGNGDVNVAGTINVAGTGAGQKGGKVTVTGKNITLAAANIDARGATAGGTVKVGGDYKGQGTLATANKVSMDADSVIDVSATDTGNGGTAILWSDNRTDYDGKIYARGGAHGGNGGFVETSSKGILNFTSAVDASAAKDADGNVLGNAGLWLLDPANVTINGIGAGAISLALLGTDVTIDTSGSGGVGNITLNNAINSGGIGSLIFNAHNNIVLNAGINLSTGIGSVTLTADWDNNGVGNITTNNNASITAGAVGGNVTLNAINVALNGLSKITTALGAIVINNEGTFTGGANSLNTGALSIGGIKVNQSNAGSIQTAINAFGTTGIGGGTLTLGSGVFDQTFQVVGKNNFTVKGQGATGVNATIIRPTSMAATTALKNGPRSDMYSAIALFKDSALSTVSDLAIDGSAVAGWGTAGLGFYNTNGFITNVDITRGGAFGVWTVADSSLAHTNGLVIANNVASRGNMWAAAGFIGDQANINILGGTYDGAGGEVAIDMSVGARGTITNAAITTGNHTGISFHGAHDVLITGGTITGSNANASGIQDDGLTYGMAPTNNVTILGTNMTGVASGVVSNGGSGWNIVGGTYTASNQSGSGAFFKDQTGTNSITGVTLNGFGNGVSANNTDGLLVTGNFINNSVHGINLVNGSDSATLTANEVTGAYKGVFAELSSGLNILANKFVGMTGFGMDLLYAGGHTIIGNTSSAVAGVNGYGLRLIGGTSSLVSANSFTDFGLYGILAQSSHDLQLLGNSVTNADYGIALTASDRATLILNVISDTTAAGIYADNGAGHTLTTNILTDVKGTGIDLRNVSDSDLTGNVITAAAGNANSGIYSLGFHAGNYVGNRYTANVVSGFGGVGIHANGNGNATLKYNVLTNNGTGIALTYGSNNSLVEGNVISGSNTGILTSYASDNVIKTNIITGVTGNGIVVNASKGAGWDTNATVTGNIVTAAAGNTGSGILFTDATNSTIGDGTLLGANVITGFGEGISLAATDRIGVRGNGLFGNQYGIMGKDTNNLTIANNAITGSLLGIGLSSSDPAIPSTNVDVTGNVIVGGTTSDGISASNIANLNINGANVITVAGTGVNVFGSEEADVSDNLIFNANYGVTLTNSARSTIARNLINNTLGTEGIAAIAVNDSNRTEITGNVADHFVDGIVVQDSNRVQATGNVITRASNDAVRFLRSRFAEITGNTLLLGGNGVRIDTNSHNATLTNNTIGVVGDGVIVNRSDDATIQGGTIIAGDTGVDATRSDRLTIDGVPVIAARGVVLDRSDNATIKNGSIITALAGDGVNATLSDDLTVNDSTIGATGNGITLDRSNGATVKNGSIVLAGGDGINAVRSSDLIVDDSTVTGLSSGIYLQLSHNARIRNGSQVIGLTGNGIHASRSDGLVVNASGVGGANHGIVLDRSDNATVRNGSIVVGLNNGIDAFRSDNLTVRDSAVIGANGIVLDQSDNARIRDSLVTALAGDGISATQSDDLRVRGSLIVATNDGIRLNGSEDARVRGNIILAGHDGIHATNISDGLRARGNIIVAGNDGISLDDSWDAVIRENVIGAFHNGISVNANENTRIDGNLIVAGNDGIYITGSDGNVITGNAIFAFHNGISLINSDPLVSGNFILAGNDGIYANNADDLEVVGNIILAGRDGVHVKNGDNFNIHHNLIGAGRDGVHVRNQTGDAIIASNLIGALRDGVNSRYTNGLDIDGNFIIAGRDGVHVRDAGLFSITGNLIAALRDGVNIADAGLFLVAGNGIAAGRDGIHLASALGNIVLGNTIIAGRDGIYGRNLLGTVIAGNNVYFAGRDGIHLRNAAFNLIALNDVDNAGRHGFNLDNADYSLIVGNTAENSGRSGFRLNATRDALLIANTADSNDVGFNIVGGSDNISLIGNTASNNRIGARVANSDDLYFAGNTYTNNLVGARIINTNDTVFDGEIFTGNTLGIDLNNSDDTRIEDTTITTAAGGTGIRIRNGSGDTIVRNLDISGGDIGVLISGPGSSMQFEGNTSRFAGNINYYFVLANNAMQGETLDASQQFFNGTRGVDMSYSQWLAAEAKTIDAESENPIGNVFYNNWENLVADFSALDEAERKRKGLYRTGLFSYAGKTLNNNIEEKPFSFQIASLDLSLLNKANTKPQTPASIANFFATLAPAAGGNASQNPADIAQQMAALAPAAGGNAAGGLGADDAAVNNFLDAGANLDYAAQ